MVGGRRDLAGLAWILASRANSYATLAHRVLMMGVD